MQAPATANIQELCSQTAQYLPENQIKRIRTAYRYAEKLHSGQKRRSGHPYITHPLAVAKILADMRLDSPSLIAAMLHDVIEDTQADRDLIQKHFGVTVANLVDGVSHLEITRRISRREQQSHNLYKVAMASAKDVRVILVKLADRLHNMRTISSMPYKSQQRIGRETLDFYAPIAHRLGLNDICAELENLSFAVIHPLRHRCISSAVRSSLQNRKDAIEKIAQEIKDSMAHAKIKAKVLYRAKSVYSIYKKMQDTKRQFSQIMDVFGYRIIVKDTNTCYRALGVAHNLYRPMDGQFEDFIAIPKKNGYQSLHTVMFGTHGIRIEIQIRTHAMEEMANQGLASHHFYKTREQGHELQHERVRKWMSSLLERGKDLSATEFMEDLRADLFANNIYVYTPDGDVIELPKGSTPVDFAYTIHTEIGNRCIACYVDGQRTMLNHILQNNETVEIRTRKNAHPSPSWIHFVTTTKARSQIRHYLREQKREDAIMLGRELLGNAISKLGYDPQRIEIEKSKRFKATEKTGGFDEILANIGCGERNATLVAHKLLGEDEKPSLWSGIQKRIGISSRYRPVTIKDTENMVVNFGSCCSPIPGDQIAGRLSAQRGLVVHNRTCSYISKSKYDDEIIVLEWSEEVQGEFTARLNIQVQHARSILAEIANLANHLDASIENLSFKERHAGESIVMLALGVYNRIHLAKIIKALRKLKYVIKVNRIVNH